LISSDVLRGYNDTIILSVLKDADSYGYEISKEISRRSGGVYAIKETTLYSAFNRLEKNGFVRTYYGDETFGKRRTYLSITDTGSAYYREKCAEWEITKELVDHFARGPQEGMKGKEAVTVPEENTASEKDTKDAIGGNDE